MTLKKILNNLLILYLFLLPWSAVYIFDEKFLGGAKWQFGTGVVYATELLLGLIFIIFIITSLVAGPRLKVINIKNKFKNPDHKTLIVIAIWLFLAWAGLSIFWSTEKSAGLYLWRYYLEASLLFFILLLSRLEIKKIYWPLVLSGALQGLLAISQFLNQQAFGHKFLGLVTRYPWHLGTLIIETENGRWLRAPGAFNDPNLLGGFLALNLIMGCWLYATTRYRKILLSLLVIITAGLFFSFARGAGLALLVGLIIYLISSKKTWSRIWLPILSIGLTLLSLSIIFSPLVFSRVNPNGRLEQRSIQERVDQNQTAWLMFKQQPLRGVGLNNYTYNLYQQTPGQPAYQYQEVENIYLLLLAELGLIGLGLFLILIIVISQTAFKNKNYQNLILLAICLLLGLFYHYPLSQYQGLIILIISLTLVTGNDKLENQLEP